MMKVAVDENVCIGSGNCQAIAPEIFKVENGLSHVKVAEVPEDLEKKTQEAIDNCPVQAISEV
ncbi:MAG: ferredoxin [Desulfobulbaceae bacterium]|nr:ferredoxin [Desulfobulbaceae bacterium]